VGSTEEGDLGDVLHPTSVAKMAIDAIFKMLECGIGGKLTELK
jgi:hypothetical protein